MGVAALFFGVAEKFRDVLNKAGNPLTSSWLLNATCIGGSVFFARLIIYLNKQFMFAPSNNTNKQHQRHEHPLLHRQQQQHLPAQPTQCRKSIVRNARGAGPPARRVDGGGRGKHLRQPNR